jgi:glutaredoxin
MRSTLCLFLLTTFALPAGAEVAKWTDAQGRVNYGTRPPAGENVRAATLRGTVSVGDGMTVLPEAGKPAAGSASDEFAKAVMAPRKGEVWIYTTPSCGYCRRAKEHMRLKGVAFTEKDVSANAAYKSEFRAMGGRGVPVTLSGSQRINGYTETTFDGFLKSAGL